MGVELVHHVSSLGRSLHIEHLHLLVPSLELQVGLLGLELAVDHQIDSPYLVLLSVVRSVQDEVLTLLHIRKSDLHRVRSLLVAIDVGY